MPLTKTIANALVAHDETGVEKRNEALITAEAQITKCRVTPEFGAPPTQRTCAEWHNDADLTPGEWLITAAIIRTNTAKSIERLPRTCSREKSRFV
jgi:hypothetical protein